MRICMGAVLASLLYVHFHCVNLSAHKLAVIGIGVEFLSISSESLELCPDHLQAGFI